jgi:recombination protein RecA
VPRKKKEEPTRQDAFKATVENIASKHGEGSIMMLGQDNVVQCEVFSTGSLTLDAAIGVGGFPRGRITEIFGPEASGKTTLCLNCVANAQAQSCTAAFIDAEHAIDPRYAKALGVNLDDCAICQPDYGEQALEIAQMLIESGHADVIIVDSVAALTPKAEIEGDMGQASVGVHGKLMSQAMRKLNAHIRKTNTCVIFTNQLRSKIGVTYGSPWVTTGGHALKYYAAVRLDIRSIGKLKTGEEVVGNRTRVKVAKNKLAPPHREAEFDILFGHGVNVEGEILDLGLRYKIVTKSGTWFSYGKVRLGQGRGNTCAFLRENGDIRREIQAEAVQAGSEEDPEASHTEDNEDRQDSEDAGGDKGDEVPIPEGE